MSGTEEEVGPYAPLWKVQPQELKGTGVGVPWDGAWKKGIDAEPGRTWDVLEITSGRENVAGLSEWRVGPPW